MYLCQNCIRIAGERNNSSITPSDSLCSADQGSVQNYHLEIWCFWIERRKWLKWQVIIERLSIRQLDWYSHVVCYSSLCPWDFPSKNTGMGFHALLQGIFLTQGLNPSLLHLLHCRQILDNLSHQGSPEQLLTSLNIIPGPKHGQNKR